MVWKFLWEGEEGGGGRGEGGGGGACTHYHAWPQSYDHIPPRPYGAGTEHVGVSPGGRGERKEGGDGGEKRGRKEEVADRARCFIRSRCTQAQRVCWLWALSAVSNRCLLSPVS